MRRPQPGERRLELERFVDRFVDELLDHRLAPRAERALAESTGEPFHAGDADAAHFSGFAIEHGDSRVREDASDFVLMTRLVVVVAEDGDRRHMQRGAFARENPRFIGQTGIGQISGEQEHVRRFRDLAEQR